MGLRVIRIRLSSSALTCGPWTCHRPYRKLQPFHRRGRGLGRLLPGVVRHRRVHRRVRRRIRGERLRQHQHRSLVGSHHLDAEHLRLGEARRGDQTNREPPVRRQIRDEVTSGEEYCSGSGWGACPCPATTRTGCCRDAVHRSGACPCPATMRTDYCPGARPACLPRLLRKRELPGASASLLGRRTQTRSTARRRRSSPTHPQRARSERPSVAL